MDRYEMALKLLTWAREHPREWDMICGFGTGSVEQNLTAAEMLRDEGFYELCLMMTARTVRLQLSREE